MLTSSLYFFAISGENRLKYDGESIHSGTWNCGSHIVGFMIDGLNLKMRFKTFVVAGREVGRRARVTSGVLSSRCSSRDTLVEIFRATQPSFTATVLPNEAR
jgi:hypothetical protein